MKDGITDKQYNEAMEEVLRYEKEIDDHNRQILLSVAAPSDDVSNLVGDCVVTDKMEIVSEPTGDLQIDEDYGVFTQVFVHQWSIGDSGDSFGGFIYGKFGSDPDKWLKIPYSC